jgi:hypothetical protein
MKLLANLLEGAERGRNQWSIDHSWAHALDPDSSGRELQRRVARQPHHAVLGRV